MTTLFDADITPESLAGRRVTVLGLGKGRSTAALARYLAGHGARVTVADRAPAEQLAEGIERLDGVPVELRLGPDADTEALAGAELVFLLPAYASPRSPVVQLALRHGTPVLTEIGLFFRLCPAPIVGVTGTKGKTTTTTLIGRMLARGTRRVVVGGNIGNAAIDELPSLAPDDIVVLELSSFQLETLAKSPHVAVITNVREDHLDYHGTREAYAAAKRNIVAWQGPRDVAVIDCDDDVAVSLHAGARSELRGFSLTERPHRGAHVEGGELVLTGTGAARALCAAADLRVPGAHNVRNALASAIVADHFGIPAPEIAEVLRAFEGVPHRQEPVAEIDGILYVNNSQGTNPDATLTALASYERPAVVILGGVAKGSDFSGLARELVARARGAVLIGQAADVIDAAINEARAAGGRELPVERAGSLREAVARARELARRGDVVLLSPACASFDMFSSYEERGDRFREVVRRMSGVPA